MFKRNRRPPDWEPPQGLLGVEASRRAVLRGMASLVVAQAVLPDGIASAQTVLPYDPYRIARPDRVRTVGLIYKESDRKPLAYELADGEPNNGSVGRAIPVGLAKGHDDTVIPLRFHYCPGGEYGGWVRDSRLHFFEVPKGSFFGKPGIDPVALRDPGDDRWYALTFDGQHNRAPISLTYGYQGVPKYLNDIHYPELGDHSLFGVSPQGPRTTGLFVNKPRTPDGGLAHFFYTVGPLSQQENGVGLGDPFMDGIQPPPFAAINLSNDIAYVDENLFRYTVDEVAATQPELALAG